MLNRFRASRRLYACGKRCLAVAIALANPCTTRGRRTKIDAHNTAPRRLQCMLMLCRCMAAILSLSLISSCATLLYPERKGNKSRVAVVPLIFDIIWLGAGIVPGVVALTVDFKNGAIYKSNASRKAKGRQDSTTPSEEEAALVLMRSAGPVVVRCFHPSQQPYMSKIDRVIFDPPYRTITTTIVMDGYLDKYFMQVKIELDHSLDMMRVTPLRENTLFPANPDCGLREWTSIDRAEEVASQVAEEFRSDIVTGVAIGGMLWLSKGDASQRLPSCLEEALLDEAVEAVVEGGVSDTVQRAIVTSVIKQSYAADASPVRTAGDALTYAVIAEIQERDPQLADALDAASLALCLSKSS